MSNVNNALDLYRAVVVNSAQIEQMQQDQLAASYADDFDTADRLLAELDDLRRDSIQLSLRLTAARDALTDAERTELTTAIRAQR